MGRRFIDGFMILAVGHAVLRLLRLDRDSRALRRLAPVWRDLTPAVPSVVLALRPGDRCRRSTAERLHRCRVEILDAAAIIGRWATPLPDDLDRLVEHSEIPECERESLRSVVELVCASRRLVDIGGAHQAGDPLLRQYDIPELNTLARLWPVATVLADRAADTPGS